LEVVKSSDVFVLLINKKSGASSKLLSGYVTPTYLEYRAALLEKKHILVFVSPEVKESFKKIQSELKKLYDLYIHDKHRPPDSPFDPCKEWIEKELMSEGIAKQFLEIADPFVWAFLYDVYNNGHWLYDFDISKTQESARNISAMLSTSLRSVVGLIFERDQIGILRNQATYLMRYADYTLTMLNEKNLIMNKNYTVADNKKEMWSKFLEEGISFLNHPINIIQAPDFNPSVVNTIKGCFAASLYVYNVNDGNILSLIGKTGEITAPDFFDLIENDIFVVDTFNNEERIIAFKEDKQTIYITNPIGDFVLCLHFALTKKMTHEQVLAYIEEIEYAIMNEHEYFFGFLKLLIGGK
jgi:hypothetical protein